MVSNKEKREIYNTSEKQEAARLWARLTGVLGGSQEAREQEEELGDWEDLDEESLGSEDSDVGGAVSGSEERRRRIYRGRLARASAREREKEICLLYTSPSPRDS